MTTLTESCLHVLPFSVDSSRYALCLMDVERVVRAVAITPLPEAPGIVLGVINVEGRILPVVNIRKRFGLQPRETRLEDHFIIARTPRRTVVLPVNSVGELLTLKRAMISADEVAPGMEHVKGVVKLKDELVLIQDLETCLSLEEEQILDQAIAGLRSGA